MPNEFCGSDGERLAGYLFSFIIKTGRSAMNLTGNTILITGGATGIGFALARLLAQLGNSVIICGRNGEALKKAQAQVPGLVTRLCDITDAESRQSMVDWLNTEHAKLNILINNAGVQCHRNFNHEGALAKIDEEVAVNFTAPICLISELLPLLKPQSNAAIVNVSSGLAFAPMADVPVYCATKAAVHSFTLSLRHQLKTTGVRVIEIVPPIVDTGLGGSVRSEGVTNRYMMSPGDFAKEALTQLENDQNEVLVGMSVNTRREGEALFERMNSR
ncbi:SDR family NAD(P)-dependent oxidoreductase [Bradyrhizobium sp. OK095]|uniref:SDR family oxidoreductase n=1 Tax=Bradyrhizobium sp. OK095 TaxID=1882760 RepID=UPI000AB92209|nr:SDR family NAD(P)-dependent oxidoreductase [Bradyrhizobium sp. OK095]